MKWSLGFGAAWFCSARLRLIFSEKTNELQGAIVFGSMYLILLSY